MRTIIRGLRNVYRSPLRAGLMVAVLAVSIGLTLIMLTVNGAFSDRLDQISAEVGTEVEVRPAGAFGFMGGGEPLLDDDVARIEALPHVVVVEPTVMTQYVGDSLEPAIDPGTLGRRFQGFQGEEREGEEGAAPTPSSLPTSFRLAITVMGTDPSASLQVFGGGEVEIVAGSTFAAQDSNANVAILGEALAEKNGLTVGSSVDLDGTSVEVVGIFSSGQRFGDNTIFMPVETVRRLFGLEGEVTSATIHVDSVDNVESVAEAIRTTLGEERVDVITSTSTFERISAPVADAKNSSRTGLIATLAASAAVILFSIGLVVRQRVREIGILKAVGASNWHVSLQFGVETLVVGVTAAIIGALVTFPAAQTVANGLVSDPSTLGGVGTFRAAQTAANGSVPEPSTLGRAFGGPTGAGGFLGDVDVAVSPEVFLYALGLAIGLAVLASVVPAWYVARVRPAEVLRHE